MLAGSRFRDDARLAHFSGQQNLSNGVIDFVGAGMTEVFTLEVNLRATQLIC